MRLAHQRGTTLIVGLLLLTVVMLLGLAGADSANIERQLARNEQFRENAASAASAGIELAISRIVTTPEPVSFTTSATFTDIAGRCEIRVRFMGHDAALPQDADANLTGAHFEITSAGYSSRRAVDRQRAIVMRVGTASAPAPAPGCEPAVAGVHCHRAGELVRLSWQRLPSP
jgi:Tfp pilus assembly protein PilX